MSVAINSSLPRTIILGFKDNSGTAEVFEEESLPIHLPLIPLFTEWGPADDAVLVGGNGFNSVFGSKSLEEGKYCTHQTEIANAVLPAANLAFIRRLVPEDADVARMRLSIDLVADSIVQYERNADGTYRRNSAGELTPKDTPVAGYRARWVLQAITKTGEEYNFGLGDQAEGELVSSEGAPSTLYPIWDWETRFPGAKGNNIGLRIVAPTLRSNTPLNADLVDEVGAYLYRFSALSRSDAQSTPQVVQTLMGDQYIEFSLKEGVVNKGTNLRYFADQVLVPGYEYENPAEFTGYGPFSRQHLYKDNLQDVLDLLYAKEKEFGLITATVTPEHTINIFGGLATTGVPYYSFALEGPSDGGLLFSENTSLYAQGGSDGTLSAKAFDDAVAAELETFGSGVVPYLDSAKYPFSCVYDSGFTLETKKLFSNVLQRHDAYVVISTQDVGASLNTASEESSIAVALRAHFRSLPESEYYGTSTCRVVIMGHAGKKLDSVFSGNLPFTVAFANKCAEYMGSADGRMVTEKAFDSNPGNIVSGFIRHNATFKPENARNRDWANGLVFAQNFDRQYIFWPGIQTIYDDNTSILNTFFNMAIGCNLTRVGERSWRIHTGDSQKTNLQFLKSVDDYIVEQTTGRYDNRVDITPKSQFTKADEQRGYSWHTDITMAGQGMKTVETLTIIAERRASETTNVTA